MTVLFAPTDLFANVAVALVVESVTASVEMTPTNAADPCTKSAVALSEPL